MSSIFLFLFSFSQQTQIDSLLSLLKKDKEDTNKVNHLNALVKEHISSEPKQALGYAQQALSLAQKIGWKKGVGNSFYSMGYYYYTQTDYPNCLDYRLKALKVSEELNDKNGIAKSFNNIGLVYMFQADYPKALDYYFKALKMDEELENKTLIAAALTNIGSVYHLQSDYPKALDYYFRALKTFEILGNKNGIASVLGSIGNVYNRQAEALTKPYERDGLFTKALDYYFRALKIAEELGNKNIISSWLCNIGLVYKDQADYPKSLDCFFRSLKIGEELGNKNTIALNLGNIGSIYTSQKKYKEAEEYILKALTIDKETGAQDDERNIEETLTTLYTKTNRYQLALEHYKKAMVLKDTLFSQENEKQLVRKEMNYEQDKKDALTKAEQDKKDAVTAEASRRERVVRYSVIGGLVMMFIIAVIIFRSLRVTRKQKNVIEKQKAIVDVRNKEIEEQKKLVEEKNKDITDSINYAQRIQRAMLPHRRDIWAAFPQSFVLFKPKDIVSGDFYYFHLTPNPSPAGEGSAQAFIAACDCTGHGVPGAFMSMIGSDKLEDAVLQSTDTSEILSLLNKGVKTALKQSSESNESTRDGMDIALCRLTPNPSPTGEGNRILHYAGANRPIWIIRKGATSVEEIKATKKAIGGFTEDNQHFDSHEIKLQEGDVFYLSTDGYADTFGKDGKKMMTKHFKEVLLGIQHKTMKEQEKHLDEFVENWKSGTE